MIQIANSIRIAAASIGLACLSACASAPMPVGTGTMTAQATGRLTIGGVVFGPADIADAKVVSTLWGIAAVQIDFTPDGHRRFNDVQMGRVGQQLPIILDGRLLSAPVLREMIAGSTIQIAGSFSLEEAAMIAQRIKDQRASR